MTGETIPISPDAQSTLLELAARTGRPTSELLDAAVEALRRELAAPVSSIPGVNPADVWEAAAQADAGQLTPHADVFAKLRSRQ
jgi:predicted transcriptional regulator